MEDACHTGAGKGVDGIVALKGGGLGQILSMLVGPESGSGVEQQCFLMCIPPQTLFWVMT